jgi:hypothetical protein
MRLYIDSFINFRNIYHEVYFYISISVLFIAIFEYLSTKDCSEFKFIAFLHLFITALSLVVEIFNLPNDLYSVNCIWYNLFLFFIHYYLQLLCGPVNHKNTDKQLEEK